MKADRNLTIEQIKQKYFADSSTSTQEEWKAEYLLYLARCEEERRNDGTYKNAPDFFKKNSINRINHYISIRTEPEKIMPEYRVFIDSMEKSLAVLMA